MRATGNSDPSLCANNLLRIVRGEVPYERSKGLDPRLIDKPIRSVGQALKINASKMIEVYEPRVHLYGIEIEENGSTGGSFRVKANVIKKEG